MSWKDNNIVKGIKSTVLGLVLICFSLYLIYQESTGLGINDYYVYGTGVFGLILLFSPDTIIKVLESIPSIIKNKFSGNSRNPH